MYEQLAVVLQANIEYCIKIWFTLEFVQSLPIHHRKQFCKIVAGGGRGRGREKGERGEEKGERGEGRGRVCVGIVLVTG